MQLNKGGRDSRVGSTTVAQLSNSTLTRNSYRDLQQGKEATACAVKDYFAVIAADHGELRRCLLFRKAHYRTRLLRSASQSTRYTRGLYRHHFSAL
jgi:hypothetical protein